MTKLKKRIAHPVGKQTRKIASLRGASPSGAPPSLIYLADEDDREETTTYIDKIERLTKFVRALHLQHELIIYAERNTPQFPDEVHPFGPQLKTVKGMMHELELTMREAIRLQRPMLDALEAHVTLLKATLAH